MWYVSAQLYIDQSKKIFDHFTCFWKWFLSLFVFMFSAYFVFYCLNMFCVEKQVLEFFSTQLVTRQSWNPSRKFIQKLWRLTHDSLATHKQLEKIFAIEPHNSPSRETSRNSFLNGFLWETYFKPLPSSLKPLFHYFYIKTQSILMVFHSISISKVIINSWLGFSS